MNGPRITAEPVRFVPRTIAHHGAHAGYEPLFRHMGLQPAFSAWGARMADWLPGALAWRLWHLRPQPTSAAGLRAELAAMPYLASGRGRLCHFIFGEDTYFLTPLWQRGGNRSIATFHYPPGRLATRINAGSVRSLHAAVIVGENQRTFLQELLPAERIHFCPHPVDTAFFCPAEKSAAGAATPPAAPRLVCSGSLFRDYPTLRRVHEAVRRERPDVETHVVGANDEQRALLAGAEGVQLHRGLSDEALRDLYRSADVGVLPLTDATANNALLEMMACGIPVIVSDSGGVRDYTAGSAARLTAQLDHAAMAQQVLNLLAKPQQGLEEGVRNRIHAEVELSYDAVASRMLAIYAKVNLLGR